MLPAAASDPQVWCHSSCGGCAAVQLVCRTSLYAGPVGRATQLSFPCLQATAQSATADAQKAVKSAEAGRKAADAATKSAEAAKKVADAMTASLKQSLKTAEQVQAVALFEKMSPGQRHLSGRTICASAVCVLRKA